MTLPNDLFAFGTACEHLLASMANQRPLTEPEVLFVKRYCQELLHKISGPPKPPE
ncbi:MAG TPA: hypothetical protein VH593_31065 [Ktedonobacteraceae bacterium]|jgi:hypothetical protein